MNRIMKILNIKFILILSPSAYSLLQCSTTNDCQTNLFTPGVSVCEDGLCTNPYEQGCLKAYAETHGKKNLTWMKETVLEKIRICNSDDDADKDNDDSRRVGGNALCRNPDWKGHFNWGEIRIGSSIDSDSLLYSWMLQIILTEVLEVPATIEHFVNKTNGKGSFYDRKLLYPHINFVKSTLNEFDALEEAFVQEDCRKTKQPCSNVIADLSNRDIIQYGEYGIEFFIVTILSLRYAHEKYINFLRCDTCTHKNLLVKDQTTTLQ